MKTIPLSQGKVALVDDADYERVATFKWHVWRGRRSVALYAIRHAFREDGTRTTRGMHREVLDAPDGVIVDHIDGDALNNTRANLRVCTNDENIRNMPRRRDNTSGYKGVSRRGDVWRAYINRDGRRFYLGNFATRELAHAAYCAAAAEHHGEFARTT